MGVQENIALIRGQLKHHPLESAPSGCLDTGNESLNEVLGKPEGIPFGKVVELYGYNSHGKTMLALYLAAKAQEQNAVVIWLDFEGSYDPKWAEDNGLDADGVYLLEPQIGRFGKKTGDLEIQSAEDVFEEAEALIRMLYEKDEDTTFFVVVDSVAAILVKEEELAGVAEQNMRTKMGTARFMSQVLRRWTPLSKVCNVITVFINQIRQNPNAGYGKNPEYTPGGQSLGFYASIRAAVRRVKGGQLKTGNVVTGLRCKVVNAKNKTGGVEGADCGFAMRFKKGTDGWMFASPKEIVKDGIEKWEPESA